MGPLPALLRASHSSFQYCWPIRRYANHGEAIRWRLAEWIHVGALHVDWTFRIDTLSTAMMLLVSGVGTLIHIYAIGYMHEDVRFKHQENRFARFFVFLNLFIAMMMILVSRRLRT